ncbi:hypothetical protein JCGZ_17955 [Jatropha curcas]|uniref:Uncharacterized protein n=1 Tax=Jatropha curcas TaxID=180498 RepID=A0A067JSE5_JATCU|nr:mitochondrial import receptor subunit TOM20 [Jatropha curcas]KDP26797.1 hypothetical protein JCGZ_17955 [Jatropha curcas]
MEFSQEDFDRLLMFEHARKSAEATYANDPLNADNLTKWGAALIELSQFQTIPEAKMMLNDAISKFEEALEINPEKADTLWYIGNVYTSLAFLNPDIDQAKGHFDKASDYYQQASEQDPSNELYRKSVEVTAKAPELHMDIHKHAISQQTMGQQTSGGGSSAASNSKGSKKNKKSNDLKYDIGGWIILAVGIVAWLGMAKSHLPPPPSPP